MCRHSLFEIAKLDKYNGKNFMALINENVIILLDNQSEKF